MTELSAKGCQNIFLFKAILFGFKWNTLSYSNMFSMNQQTDNWPILD